MKKLYRNYKYTYEDVYELIDELLCNKKVSIVYRYPMQALLMA